MDINQGGGDALVTEQGLDIHPFHRHTAQPASLDHASALVDCPVLIPLPGDPAGAMHP